MKLNVDIKNDIPENGYDWKSAVLKQKLLFPVYCFKKENGFLALMSYNPKTDDLFIASKSTDKGDFVNMIKQELDKLDKTFKNKVKEFCKTNNCTLIFECINQDLDPHIIRYSENQLVLLDIVKNKFEDEFMPYEEVQKLAKELKVKCKVLDYTFNNWDDLYSWRQSVKNDYSIRHEGWVIQDTNNFRVKMKTCYYNFWKYMRGIKHQIEGGSEKRPSFKNEFEINVYNLMRSISVDKLKQLSIIDIAEEFYKNIDK